MNQNSFFNKLLFYVQRRSHNIQLRNLLAWVYRLFLPKADLKKGIKSLEIEKGEDEILHDLNKDGFSDLGIILSQSKINSITKRLQEIECFDMSRQECPIVDLNSPGDAQLAHYKREDLVVFEEILEIANDSKILNSVSKYLKTKPTISNINCWWSFGNRKSAKEAQFFHRDLDDYKFVKLFFYLSDVKEESGPHIYVKGSHESNKLIALRRFGDEEVYAKYDRNNILTLIRPKGSCFLEDTYGIHKGQLPQSGNRLLLQIQYSYAPIYVEKYNPSKSSLLEKLKLDTYINRLLLKSF